MSHPIAVLISNPTQNFFKSLGFLLSIHSFFLLLTHYFAFSSPIGNKMTDSNPSSLCRTSCGQHEIRFPVGIDIGCGTPQLFMTCTNDTSLQIALDSSIFLVETIDYENQTLLLRDPLMSDCVYLRSYSTGLNINLTARGMRFSKDTTILLLNCFSLTQQLNFLDSQYDCHSPTCLVFTSDCYQTGFIPCCRMTDPNGQIDLNKLQCMSYTSIYAPKDPMIKPQDWSYGIEIQWDIPPGIIDLCDRCQDKNGSCGYDIRYNPAKFQCLCDSSIECKACFPNCSSKRKKLIIGVTTGGGLLLAAGIACLFLRTWHQKFKKIRSHSAGDSEDYLGFDKQINMELVHVMAAMTGPLPLAVFSYKELSHATASFSDNRMLGDGGYGVVYKAKFCDGRELAVKRLNHSHHRRLEHFYNEVRILSQVKHPNLVQLVGLCVEGKDLLLVYEYICNGTLEEHIHGAQKLNWETRLNIAYEVADALAYLHFTVSPPIYHRDVKTSNILLDKDLRAKVADFGLSRLVPMAATHVSTGPQGTPGYVDPEYHQCYQVTDKSDVFSFGVVLLELITGQKAVDLSRPHNEINLSALAMDRIQRGELKELLDPEICSQQGNERSAHQVGELAFACIAMERRSRPDMKEVRDRLKQIRAKLREEEIEGEQGGHREGERPTEGGPKVTS